MQIIVLKLSLLILLSYASICLATNESTEIINFELNAGEQSPYSFALPREQINKQVSQNLANWHYPVKSGLMEFSLLLTAKLEKISHQQTPAGFSFSVGNSDPRATDFQKADVLPITCQLKNITTNSLIAEQQTTFSQQATTGEQKQTEALINQISTACFNLLESAKIPQSANTTNNQAELSSWRPSIRFQTVNPTVISNEIKTKNLVNPGVEEEKKQIIIENQGTPLIFQFGHERQ